MSRETWNLIKNSKRFYVSGFRATGSVLVLSMIMNLFLGLAVYYTYFNLPDNDCYVTDGVNAPVLLTPMDEPNYTSVPLLANDPQTDDENREIPQ
jgi:intracellular multiplication protein IcmM